MAQIDSSIPIPYVKFLENETHGRDGAIDASGSPEVYKYQSPEGITTAISTLTIIIEDQQAFKDLKYASLNDALGTGITVWLYGRQENPSISLLSGSSINITTDWLQLCSEMQMHKIQSNSTKAVALKWFIKRDNGRDLILNEGQELAIVLADDFSDLDRQDFSIQGFRGPNIPIW